MEVFANSISNEENMKQYSKEFKENVRKLYGSQYDTMLESGHPFLGRHLDDSSNGTGVSIDEILNATNLNTLQEKVRIQKQKQELYSLYWKEEPSKR